MRLAVDKSTIGVPSNVNMKQVVEYILPNGMELSWNDEIYGYPTEDKLPESFPAQNILKYRASCFTIMNGELYKRFFKVPLLRCLTAL